MPSFGSLELPDRAELEALPSEFTVRGIEARDTPWGSMGAVEAKAVSLDTRYENGGKLVFCRFAQDSLAGAKLDQLVRVGLGPSEEPPIAWDSPRLPRPCLCQALRIAVPGQPKLALTQAATFKQDIFVLARMYWTGMPIINRWFVGFKPGMRERTEDLLLAGLDLLQPEGGIKPRPRS
jgi:hypothetical protein